MKRFVLVFALVLATLHLITPKPVTACTATPTGLPPYSLEEHINATEIILEGTVIGASGEFSNQTATVQVHQYLKGDGPTEVTITNFGPSSMCLASVEIGKRLIFFVEGDPATGLRAFYRGAGTAVRFGGDGNVAAIRAIIDPASVTPPLVVTPPAKPAPSSSSVGRTLWAVLTSLLVLAQR
jgi:hypothetical protein